MTMMIGNASSSQCSVCGPHGPSTLPFPLKTIPNVGLPQNTTACLDLEKLSLSSSLTSMAESSGVTDTDEDSMNVSCSSIQALGTYCGCNVPADACTLCWDGRSVPRKARRLRRFRPSDFVAEWTTNNHNVASSSMDCETVQALLHNVHSTSQQCLEAQIEMGQQCGCPPMPNALLDEFEYDVQDKEADDNQSSARTAQRKRDDPESSRRRRPPPQQQRHLADTTFCKLCENGEPPPFADKLVDLGRLNETAMSCAEWHGMASNLDANSDDCALVRGLGGLCGCPTTTHQCTLCPLGEPTPRPDRPLNWLGESFFAPLERHVGSDSLSCELMQSLIATDEHSVRTLFGTNQGLVCLASQMKSDICGCRQDWRPFVLMWCFRLSGISSFIGSLLIVWSILSKPKEKRFSTYHQFVLGLAAFDSIGSLSFILGGVLAPREAGFYRSRGSYQSCKVQGFMLQMGQTCSMFYNLCLSLYFLFVMVFNWQERHFQRVSKLVHVGVVLVGLSMASAAVPFVEAQFGMCGILPPLVTSQYQISLFYTVPVSIVLIVLTSVTAVICRKVYKVQKKAQRWMVARTLKVSRMVFWQSFWYVMAFYATLPFVLVSFYVDFDSPRTFWVLVGTAILAPLQGVVTALVYFQRKSGGKFFFGLCPSWCSNDSHKRPSESSFPDRQRISATMAQSTKQKQPSSDRSGNSHPEEADQPSKHSVEVDLDGTPCKDDVAVEDLMEAQSDSDLDEPFRLGFDDGGVTAGDDVDPLSSSLLLKPFEPVMEEKEEDDDSEDDDNVDEEEEHAGDEEGSLGSFVAFVESEHELRNEMTNGITPSPSWAIRKPATEEKDLRRSSFAAWIANAVRKRRPTVARSTEERMQGSGPLARLGFNGSWGGTSTPMQRSPGVEVDSPDANDSTERMQGSRFLNFLGFNASSGGQSQKRSERSVVGDRYAADDLPPPPRKESKKPSRRLTTSSVEDSLSSSRRARSNMMRRSETVVGEWATAGVVSRRGGLHREAGFRGAGPLHQEGSFSSGDMSGILEHWNLNFG